MGLCPVCGGFYAAEGAQFEPHYEEETYPAAEGATLKMVIPYCNQGRDCNAVLAVNLMDALALPFKEAMGEP